jgi:AraC family transcriptional regulator, melibiose operon regulatory protein
MPPIQQILAQHSFGLRSWVCQPQVMPLPHRHSDIEINYLLAGQITYLHRDQEVTILAGRLAIFWAAIPHQLVEQPTPGELCILTIPFEQFVAWKLPDLLTRALLLGEMIIDPDVENSLLDQLLCLRWHEDLTKGRQHLALMEIEARLLRLAGRDPLALSLPAQEAVGKTLQMARYIVENYTEALSVQMVADAVGLHPNYAMNCFKKSFRMTMLDYLLQYRVTQALRLLATTDLPILEIGWETGFRSTSNFYTTFKRFTGRTPRSFRQLGK